MQQYKFNVINCEIKVQPKALYRNIMLHTPFHTAYLNNELQSSTITINTIIKIMKKCSLWHVFTSFSPWQVGNCPWMCNVHKAIVDFIHSRWSTTGHRMIQTLWWKQHWKPINHNSQQQGHKILARIRADGLFIYVHLLLDHTKEVQLLYLKM